MASLYHSLFTEKGLELLRTAIQSGTKLGITHMSFGDGNGVLPVPDAKFTQMVKEVYRVALNRLAPSKENANWLEADGVIPSAVGGFNIREVGLWAGNVMVAYANYPPTYKPTGDQGTAQIKTIRIVLQIDNTANFELKIDASVVMATIQAVEDAKAEVKEYADKVKEQVFSSLDEMIQFPDPKNGQKVTVKSFYENLSIGGGEFEWFENDTSDLVTGFIVVGQKNGRWKRKIRQHTILDFGGYCDYDPILKTGHNDVNAISESLNFLGYAVITDNTKIDQPIYMKSNQSLQRLGNSAIIYKTTKTNGTGSSKAPNRVNIIDNYEVDAGIIIIHEDNNYAINVDIDIELAQVMFNKDSIAIYAPRFYMCEFKFKSWGFGAPIVTYDGFNSTVQAKSIGSAYGPRWLSDGSSNMTGTTIDFSNSWVLFDTTYNQPIKGFDLYQLWYSSGDNLACDNGIRQDGQAVICYDFLGCKSINFTGVGAENNLGTIVRVKNSSVMLASLKSAKHYGGNFVDKTGVIEVDGGDLTISKSTFDPIINPGNIYNEVLSRGGALSYVDNSAAPTGGNPNIDYAGGASKKVEELMVDRTYIDNKTMYVRDGKIFRKDFEANFTNNLIIQLFSTSDISLKISIKAKTSSGVIVKTFDVISLNQIFAINQISTTKVGEIADFSIEMMDKNIFLRSEVGYIFDYTVETYDTFLHGNVNNFIRIS